MSTPASEIMPSADSLRSILYAGSERITRSEADKMIELLSPEFEKVRTATINETVPRRFAEHLVHNSLGSRCELTSFVDSSKCSGKAVAIRWEAGFADDVCQDHAETAVKRGAVVVFARHHDGTEGS